MSEYVVYQMRNKGGTVPLNIVYVSKYVWQNDEIRSSQLSRDGVVETRLMELPTKKARRAWVKSLAGGEPMKGYNITDIAKRETRKVYLLLTTELMPEGVNADRVVGSFRTIEDMENHKKPGMWAAYFYLQHIRPLYFVNEPPTNEEILWGLEDITE